METVSNELEICPNCDGCCYFHATTTRITHGCCGSFNSDGSCCGNAIPVPVEEEVHEPCQQCDGLGLID